MEEADKDWMMIRMVGGWVFLLVPAHPGSPGQRAVKRLLCCCCCCTNATALSVITSAIKVPLIGPDLSEWRLSEQCLLDYCLSD